MGFDCAEGRAGRRGFDRVWGSKVGVTKARRGRQFFEGVNSCMVLILKDWRRCRGKWPGNVCLFFGSVGYEETTLEMKNKTELL